MFISDGTNSYDQSGVILGNFPASNFEDRLWEQAIQDNQLRERRLAEEQAAEREAAISEIVLELDEQLGISQQLDTIADSLEAALGQFDDRIQRTENRITQVVAALNEFGESLPDDAVTNPNPNLVGIWRKRPAQ